VKCEYGVSYTVSDLSEDKDKQRKGLLLEFGSGTV
jgi:hypothetical protein